MDEPVCVCARACTQLWVCTCAPVHLHLGAPGVWAALLERLMGNARELGVRRVFCLTFETGFFGRHGFVPLAEALVDPVVRVELMRSSDEGVAEFLDLERVKPNTLGNTRMLALV